MRVIRASKTFCPMKTTLCLWVKRRCKNTGKNRNGPQTSRNIDVFFYSISSSGAPAKQHLGGRYENRQDVETEGGGSGCLVMATGGWKEREMVQMKNCGHPLCCGLFRSFLSSLGDADTSSVFWVLKALFPYPKEVKIHTIGSTGLGFGSL